MARRVQSSHIIVLGLKALIGLVSSGMFLYQSILLLQNYNMRDTFRTIKEMDIKGPMPSPLVIICQDPGSLNISDDSVRVTPYSHSNFSFIKIVTAFKGYCSMIDSVTMNETEDEQAFMPGLCFPSESRFFLFVLFPGQKVFISIYHPKKALSSVELSGLSYFNAVVITKVTKKLAGVDNCLESKDDFDSLVAVQKEFEKCILEKIFSEVRYHPLIENFPEYESLRREPVPYNESDKFVIPNFMVPAYDSCRKPCTDVTYSFEAEPFSALTSEETRLVSGCSWWDSPSLITIQFSRRLILEYEDYVVKGVDLISGIGGTLGLWLGLSALSIGTFCIHTLKSLSSLKMF